MADIIQTEGDFRLIGESTVSAIQAVQFGEAVTIGAPVYLNSGDGLYYLSNCGAAATALINGLVVSPGGANDWGLIMIGSGFEVDIGATLTAGTEYVVSDTNGAIMPSSDLTVGQYYVLVGIGNNSGNLITAFSNTGATHP